MKKLFLILVFTVGIGLGIPAVSATPVPGSPGTTDTTSGAAATQIIAKPGHLEAKDLSTKTEYRIRLSWDASKSTDIEGYNIYRKLQNDKDYTKIASVKKGTERYDDTTKLTTGISYMYITRSYKGDAESADSNPVTLTAVDLATKNVETKPLVAINSIGDLNNLPISPVFIILSLGVLIVAAVLFLNRRQLSKKAPHFYKNIIDTSLKSTANKFFAILLAAITLIILLSLAMVINREGFSIFVK